jgi:hypothetical protein
MKGIFERLPNGILRFAWLFYFDEDRRFRSRVAKCEVSPALSGLLFRPNHRCIPTLPSELLKDAEHDPLRNCLLIWKLTLAETGSNVVEGDFE